MKFLTVKLFVSSILVYFMTNGVAFSTILNFTIEGTYGDSIRDSNGVLLFDIGDSFAIHGKIDDALQPDVEQHATGAYTYQDTYLSFYPAYPYTYSLDYSKVVSISYTNLSLSAISNSYPSEENALNSGDLKNGSYIVEQYIDLSGNINISHTFQDSSDYTSLTIQSGGGVSNAWIYYNYRIETTTQGEFTLVQSLHDTISLNITTFDIQSTQPNTIPEPATVVLLGVGLLSLAGMNRKNSYRPL